MGFPNVDSNHASKCLSSRSPHQVRTGLTTWQSTRGVPRQVVVERVATPARPPTKHSDQPSKREELDSRHREQSDRIDSGVGGKGR